MKKFSRKSVLLFAAVVALCAFAMPSMASAGNWAGAPATHTIDSSNLSMFISAVNAGWICTSTSFDVDVKSPASNLLTITGANFGSCSGTNGFSGCTIDITASGLDWNANGSTPSNVSISTVRWAMRFTPTCSFAGTIVDVEGTLNAGVINNATHSLSLTNAPGLTGFIAGSLIGSVVVNGTLTDTSGTLTLS